VWLRERNDVEISLQAYGEAGVVKLIRILEREITTGMRLLGATRIGELTPDMVSFGQLPLRNTERYGFRSNSRPGQPGSKSSS
jgi:hypothetical protein